MQAIYHCLDSLQPRDTSLSNFLLNLCQKKTTLKMHWIVALHCVLYSSPFNIKNDMLGCIFLLHQSLFKCILSLFIPQTFMKFLQWPRLFKNSVIKNVLTDFKNCRIYERNYMYINKIKALKVVNLNYCDHQRQH